MSKTVAEALQGLTDAVNVLTEALKGSNREMQAAIPKGLVMPEPNQVETASPKAKKGQYSEVDGSTSQAEREKRQKLILAAIVKAGGTVPRAKWLEITSKYGYSSKRLGGFFGRGTNGASAGMVEMSDDRSTVSITTHGRSRLL